ncbi:MAG TPA: DUF58 domain-containing protein [Ilumatobacteraceae bacterium]
MNSPFAGTPTKPSTSGWRPTVAQVLASVVAVVLAAVAVLWRRPDLLVIGAPFVAVAAWSSFTRPQQAPEVTDQLADTSLREGDATTWSARLEGVDGMDCVVAVIPSVAWVAAWPESGASTAVAVDGVAVVSAIVRSLRWGRRAIGPVTLVANDAWGSFRWVSKAPQHELTSLPLPAVFGSTGALQRANGLVGVNRSVRAGEGSEFAGIREFRSGDRMRRINWPRSLRAGTLHVTSTWTDQDNLVLLEVDATDDIGFSGGVDGQASSLDRTVRATAAIAEHYLHRGDRVSMGVFGSSPARLVPPATGSAHLRRILDNLASIRPGTDPRGLSARHQQSLPADTLAIMLSPLVSHAALERVVTLARHGFNVVVVETLPGEVVEGDDPIDALAWRIRLLERRREMGMVQEMGIPVVTWIGPGSLDNFLREAARRARAPRLVRR